MEEQRSNGDSQFKVRSRTVSSATQIVVSKYLVTLNQKVIQKYIAYHLQKVVYESSLWSLSSEVCRNFLLLHCLPEIQRIPVSYHSMLKHESKSTLITSLLLKTPVGGGSHNWPVASNPFLLPICGRWNSQNDPSDPHPYIIPSLVCAEPINMMKYHPNNHVS